MFDWCLQSDLQTYVCSKTLHPSNLITVDRCRGLQPISATWRRWGSSSTERRKLMVGTHPHTQREHTHTPHRKVLTTPRTWCQPLHGATCVLQSNSCSTLSVWVFSPAPLLLVWNSVYFQHTIRVSCVYENTKNTETHMWTGAPFSGICLHGCWTVCVCCQMSAV